jgi:AcrR family transcriptional regulator
MRTAPTRADRRHRTRAELVAAADRRFTADGYHATSLDAVADEAGFTKGAVYSNFASKEDLFFAVYERRVERGEGRAREVLDAAPTAFDGVRALIRESTARREHDDGWLAVFLEFWTYVLRHPEHRARFAALHARAVDPFAAALERHAEEHGLTLPLDARRLATAFFATGTGLNLERLTQPDVVGPELSLQMQELFMDALERSDPHGSQVPGAPPG